MATGYTWSVKDGHTRNLSDYLSKFFENLSYRSVDDYYQRSVEKCERKLEKARTLTEHDALACLREERASEIRQRTEWFEGVKLYRARYERMLTLVRAWNPQNKILVDIKASAIEQLEDSIRFDCEGSWWQDDPEKRETQSPAEYIREQIEYAEEDLACARRRLAEEIRITNDFNDAVRELKETVS